MECTSHEALLDLSEVARPMDWQANDRVFGLQLGIFLCMRCAAIHRKLGTHISKVKSLSMDTWSTEQVEVSLSTLSRFKPVLTRQHGLHRTCERSATRPRTELTIPPTNSRPCRSILTRRTRPWSASFEQSTWAAAWAGRRAIIPAVPNLTRHRHPYLPRHRAVLAFDPPFPSSRSVIERRRTRLDHRDAVLLRPKLLAGAGKPRRGGTSMLMSATSRTSSVPCEIWVSVIIGAMLWCCEI
jgi:hypothetical protein